MSGPSPLAEGFSIFQDVGGHFPVRHLNRFLLALATIGEWLAAFGFECASVPIIDFKIEHTAGDQTDHDAVVVDAIAAEHGSGSSITEGAEHVEDVFDEWRCHGRCLAQFSRPANGLLGWNLPGDDASTGYLHLY